MRSETILSSLQLSDCAKGLLSSYKLASSVNPTATLACNPSRHGRIKRCESNRLLRYYSRRYAKLQSCSNQNSEVTCTRGSILQGRAVSIHALCLVPRLSHSGRRRVSVNILTSILGEKLGRIKMELYKDVTPKTAENFRQFCTGETKNSQGRPQGYKGSKFHRVVSTPKLYSLSKISCLQYYRSRTLCYRAAISSMATALDQEPYGALTSSPMRTSSRSTMVHSSCQWLYVPNARSFI